MLKKKLELPRLLIKRSRVVIDLFCRLCDEILVLKMPTKKLPPIFQQNSDISCESIPSAKKKSSVRLVNTIILVVICIVMLIVAVVFLSLYLKTRNSTNAYVQKDVIEQNPSQGDSLPSVGNKSDVGKILVQENSTSIPIVVVGHVDSSSCHNRAITNPCPASQECVGLALGSKCKCKNGHMFNKNDSSVCECPDSKVSQDQHIFNSMTVDSKQ